MLRLMITDAAEISETSGPLIRIWYVVPGNIRPTWYFAIRVLDLMLSLTVEPRFLDVSLWWGWIRRFSGFSK